jgi:hypothetical protein
VVVDGNVVDDAYQALMSLGLSPIDARNRLDRVLTGGHTFKSAQDIIEAIFKTP